MSETIQVALITFASGAIGAIAGVIGGYISAKCAAQVELQKAVFSSFVERCLSAYTEFFTIYSDYLCTPCSERDIKITQSFGLAANRVRLVASYETSHAVADFARFLPEFDLQNTDPKLNEKFESLKDRAFSCMEQDLHSFEVPNIRDSHGLLDRLRRKIGKK